MNKKYLYVIYVISAVTAGCGNSKEIEELCVARNMVTSAVATQISSIAQGNPTLAEMNSNRAKVADYTKRFEEAMDRAKAKGIDVNNIKCN